LTTLCPGLTNTGFVKTADLESTTLNKMGTANAKDVAEYGFKIMMKGKRIGIHGFQNKIMAILVNILPAKFILPVAAKILSHK
ncbi:MAG: short-chain dehydrogenase, partial [Bacteroidota bacterium]|nr:short-chain dehydrogenase [Bacteroidota bacterium]